MNTPDYYTRVAEVLTKHSGALIHPDTSADFLRAECPINDQDIVGWSQAEAAKVQLGGRWDAYGCCPTYHKPFHARAINGQCEFGDTLHEALALAAAHIPTSAQLAEQKRTQAAKLLAEADALSPANAVT